MNAEKGSERSIFCEVKNVELDGTIYDIFPLECEPGIFIVVNNESQEMARLTVKELEEQGFNPVESVKRVKMDPETGLPENPIDHLEQMRYESQDRLDACCKGKLFIP